MWCLHLRWRQKVHIVCFSVNPNIRKKHICFCTVKCCILISEFIGKRCRHCFCISVQWRCWKWLGWPSRVVSVARCPCPLIHIFMVSVGESLLFHSYSHSFLVYSCPCEDKRDVLGCKCVCVCLRMWWLILWLHSFSQLIGLFTSLKWNEFMRVPDWLLRSCAVPDADCTVVWVTSCTLLLEEKIYHVIRPH